MDGEKNQQHELVNANICDENIQSNAHIRQKNYMLDKAKALNKKVDACYRNIDFEDKNGNYVVSMNTAGFEAFRYIILENIHMSNRTASRHTEYIVDQDEAGMIVSDTIKIKSWQGLKVPLAQGRKGAIKITINLYTRRV